MNFPIASRKVVILTGAYRGIGAILLKELVREYTVWPVCRTMEQTSILKQSLGVTSEDMCWFHGDLCQRTVIDDLKNASKSIEIHALIHCPGPIEYSAEAIPVWDSWRDMYELNMKAAVNLIRTLGPGMTGGRIILFGFSGNSLAKGYEQIAAYAAAKEALIVLARSAARELASSQTTVNVVAPGVFKTDTGKIPNEGVRLLQKIPFARFGEDKDISGVVEWILGSGSGYVTGQIIKVSGGLHIS